MGILKTLEMADIAENNAKRIRVLKTVGLADFAEKIAKRMGTKCRNAEKMRIRMLLFDRAN